MPLFFREGNVKVRVGAPSCVRIVCGVSGFIAEGNSPSLKGCEILQALFSQFQGHRILNIAYSDKMRGKKICFPALFIPKIRGVPAAWKVWVALCP